MAKLNIDDLLNDRTSGSFEITKKTLHIFSDQLVDYFKKSVELEEIYIDLQSTSKIILKHQPNMVLLRKSTSSFLTHFKRILSSGASTEELKEDINQKLEIIVKSLTDDTEKIAGTGSRIIANSNMVMTVSNSTHVRNILLTAHRQKRRFEVYCLKSHPPDEGIKLAEFLSSKGIKTTLIADSEMGVFMPQMNLVLVGADRIYEDGFINKSGTLPLCLTADHNDIPVYLAAETSKILLESERAIKQVTSSKEEIYNGKSRKLKVENIYFEKIPLHLLHKIICEDSVFETHEFKNWYLKG